MNIYRYRRVRPAVSFGLQYPSGKAGVDTYMEYTHIYIYIYKDTALLGPSGRLLPSAYDTPVGSLRRFVLLSDDATFQVLVYIYIYIHVDVDAYTDI